MVHPYAHYLKTWPQYFEAVLSGERTFEVRRDDREYTFEVGDFLCLQEWIPEEERYTGRAAICKITYKLNGGSMGIEHGYCVLGIKLL